MVNYLYIAMKAFQQLNVVHEKYAWVFPVSMTLAACEFITIGIVAKSTDWTLAIAMGIGAGLGSLTSMVVHKRLRDGN